MVSGMDVSQFSLEGKTALVTGGSRGIGEATALAFARAGADVAVTSRKLPDLEKVADEIRALGRKALAVEAHVGRMDQLQPMVDKVVAEFGKIDILINNAGTNHNAPAIDMEERSWDSVINTNLKGLFFLSQAVARVMRDKGKGGSIVNIASTSGYKAQIPTGHYSIAKAGVIMATKVMALEWAGYGIRANCIAPGATKTRLWDAIFEPMGEGGKAAEAAAEARIPLRRVGDPRETANAILFLASDAASYVTGQSFAVDGGALLT